MFLKMGNKIIGGKLAILCSALVLFNACKPNLSNTLRTRSSSNSTNTAVAIGQGYALLDNPIILSNNPAISPDTNLNKFKSVVDITTESFLYGDNHCYGSAGAHRCFEVKANEIQAAPLQTADGKWGFDTSTPEFLQVHTYYHLDQIMTRFFNDLDMNYAKAYLGSSEYYPTALPDTAQVGSGVYKIAIDSPLEAYADCDYADNAYYNNATNTLCFGYTSEAKALKWAQDPTVVYHEAGHFIQYLQLNLRNFGLIKKANLGNYYYDEAGSIGEGLSDYFSYYLNQRTHFAEWATGRLLKVSRPMSEDDALHVPALAKESGRRLSYPDYLTYDPNDPTVPTEDIHYAGMIISHFLVALTEDFSTKCNMTTKEAQSQVMYLLNETMAELGDLNSKGLNSAAAGRINLNATYAYDWQNKVNPINYRSFMQTLSKFVLQTMGNSSLNRCNGSIYTKDQLEALVDDYGLLLFRTYNEHRNNASPSTPALNNTAVTATNRNKTVLISKDLIVTDPTAGASPAYVIDKQAAILSGITSLQTNGTIGSLSSQTPSDLGFNNGNGKVSPGEVVAIGLNLYNNSNATMGNVQVLANDWKTLDSATGKPCIYSSNISNDSTWTTSAEGGIPCADNSVTAATASDFQPICVMQYNGTSATTWISQHTYRQKLALDSALCLNDKDDRDCFIRAIKGADQANFSKINPKKNWFQTMQDPNTTSAYSLNWGNVILFEVSKHVPPGTIVDCRFRVRFTNCDDCYHDSSRSNYDFTDIDYNGPKPYKIIHLKMTIID